MRILSLINYFTMKFVCFLILISFATISGLLTIMKKVEEPVMMTVFYESYCPYSKDFLHTQLYPVWVELRQYFTLYLVPFGNARMIQDGDHVKISCQHGEEECKANILHSCAIQQACGNTTLNCSAESLQKALDYINCQVQQTYQTDANHQCAKQSGLSGKNIEDCLNSKEGVSLESFYGNVTLSNDPPVTHVPFIIINHRLMDVIGRDGLKSVLCPLLPEDCQGCL